jgi:hypothetical protein
MHGACLGRDRERKVSFIEAWHVLQTNGVRTYRYDARVLAKGQERHKHETTWLIFHYVT